MASDIPEPTPAIIERAICPEWELLEGIVRDLFDGSGSQEQCHLCASNVIS